MGSTSVEVWDSLTLEKCSSLQLTKPNPETWTLDSRFNPPDVLSYSPDGCSLAGYLNASITIWDIQTGGIAEEIKCGATSTPPQTLVWSLDGKAVGTVASEEGTWVVCTYDTTSGVKTSTSTILSSPRPYLWPNNNSLQVMTMTSDGGIGATINIFEVWPVLVDNPIESFSINHDIHGVCFESISFSPATYRISIITSGCPNPYALFALDIQKSIVLLQDDGPFYACSLSPDGSFLAASGPDADTQVWKYTSGQGYILWRRFSCWGSESNTPGGCQFSPASSSILISSGISLKVHQLDGPTTDPSAEENLHYGEFSTDGTYVVTATERGQVVTITNLYENSSQFINTDFAIHGLTLTGNVLLVQGLDVLVAWRVTEGGTVDGTSGIGSVDWSNSLWTKLLSGEGTVSFWTEDDIGVVEHSGNFIYYDTDTGRELGFRPIFPPHQPHPPPHKNPNDKPECYDFENRTSFSCDVFVSCDDPPRDNLPPSTPWYKEGWVKHAEGEHWHWFWLPAPWRPGWEATYQRPDWFEAHWLDEVTTLRLETAFGLVIIKF